VSIGAWAQTTILNNSNCTIVVEDGVATINVINPGGLNSSYPDEWAVPTLNGVTSVVLKGAPNASDYTKFSKFSEKITMVDLSGVTSTDKPNLPKKTNTVILKEGAQYNNFDIFYGNVNNNAYYVIVKNEPLDVYVNVNGFINKQECEAINNTWLSNETIASNDAIVHMFNGGDDATTNKLLDMSEGHDNITIVDQNGKAINDLIITDGAIEDGTANIATWLSNNNRIKNLIVKGTLSDPNAFNDQNVIKDADFSGVTGGYASLVLPSCGGKIILPGTVEYSAEKVVCSSSATNEEIENAVSVLKSSSNNKNIKTITLPNGSVYDVANQQLTLTASDETTDNYSAIKTFLSDLGYSLNKTVFSTGSYFDNAGKLLISEDDDNSNRIAELAALVVKENVNKLELPDGSTWDKATKNVTTKTDEAQANADATRTKLTEAGFEVNNIVERPTSDDNPNVEVYIKDGKLHIKSTAENSLKELLNTNPPTQKALNAIEDIQSVQGLELVFEGKFSNDDISAVVNKGNSKAKTVDLRAVTFDSENDAKNFCLEPFANTVETVYMSNDSHVTTISETLFRNMKEKTLKNLYIGNSVTEVPNNRFQGYKSLEFVSIPSSLITIGSNAFHNCTNLKTVDFGTNCHVETISSNAFEQCDITGDLVIPNSVKTIGDFAFKQNVNITSLVINKGSELESIGNEAFRMNTKDFKLKNVYVYAEKEIECHKNAWDFYMTDGQTVMATVMTRLHYPPSMYYWYVGDWKSQVNGGRIEGHDDLLRLRNAVDDGSVNGITVTPKGEIGWQKFISSGIPVTFDMDWRTYSDIVDLKVPEYDHKVADVYIVCGYQDGKAVLKQMKQNDIIPARTGMVIHHYVKDQTYGGLLMFPHVTDQEAATLTPEQRKPYRYVSEGDKRGVAGRIEWNKDEWLFGKGMNYVDIETRDYECDGKSYHNYLEAIHCMGVQRAIYNAENGNYIDYNTLEMKAYKGQKVTYRNFFFGNGEKLQASMNAGNIGSGKDWKADKDGKMGWGFFRCVTDMYAINSKAFLHYPADVFTQSHSESPGTITEGITASAKTFDNMILLDEDFSSPSSVATGITTMDHETTTRNEGYYTIQGVKVSTPIKNGLYIHNGKKYIVK
jgi:hypothetical protein